MGLPVRFGRQHHPVSCLDLNDAVQLHFRYCDFMNWKTRQSLLKPLRYFVGPTEPKNAKQKKGKLLPLRVGEHVTHTETGANCVVLVTDKKTCTVENRADHSTAHFDRSSLQSQDIGEEKPRGSLQLSVRYDPSGFGELVITCHSVKGVSASKANGCQYFVQEENWVPKNSMGKPLKMNHKEGEAAKTLPETEHEFHLFGVKDVKDNSVISVVLKGQKKIGVGTRTIGGISFYVKDLMKQGPGVYQKEWVGLFSDFEADHLDRDEVLELEGTEVMVKGSASDFTHLGKNAHTDVAELVTWRFNRQPDKAFDLESIVPTYMLADFTTPHMSVPQ